MVCGEAVYPHLEGIHVDKVFIFTLKIIPLHPIHWYEHIH